MRNRPTLLRRFPSGSPRLAAVPLGVAVLALLLSSSAALAEGDLATVGKTLNEVDYRSGSEPSHVQVSQNAAGQVIFTDDVGLTAEFPCLGVIGDPNSPLDVVNCGGGVGIVNLFLDAPGGSATPEAVIPTEVSGGDGTQVVNLGGTPDASDVEYDGGPGSDVVNYSRADRFVTVTLDDKPDDGRPGDRDEIQPTVERIVGSSFPDRLTGSGFGNVFDSGFGPDVASGLGGADVFLEGTRSNGGDTVTGGAGLDRVDYSARTAPVSVSLNGVADDGQSGETDNVRADVEAVFSGSSADVLLGNNAANTLDGAGDDDVLNGRGGSDLLVGGQGDDSLFGGGGVDRLVAQDGDPDLVNCGPGRDVAVVDRGLDAVRGCETVTFG